MKIASVAPIEDFSEEVTELTESEEQAVAEVGGQRGQIRNGDHFFFGSELCTNGVSGSEELDWKI